MNSFILCAGKGTRLAPLTIETPKCLLDIVGTPVLGLIIEWLDSYGIKNHVCNAHWKKELIKDFAAKTKHKLRVVEEIGEDSYGTCGGVMNALPYLEDKFILIYGDIVTNCNLNRIFNFHNEKNADCTIVTNRVEDPWNCGVVYSNSDGFVTKIEEKPDKESIKSDLVNSGILVVKKSFFEKYRHHGFFDIFHDLMPVALKDELKIFQIPLNKQEFLIDMGTFKNYEKAKGIYDYQQNANED